MTTQMQENNGQGEFVCPVCGYDGLFEPPYNSRGRGSYEICRQCGFQFGYDDYPYEEKDDLIRRWRDRWRSCGCPIFTKTGKYWEKS